MKSRILAVLCALALGGAAWSQGLAVGGAASTDDRVSADSNPQLSFQEYRLELTADAKPADTARFHGEAWIRSAGIATPVTSASTLFNVGSAAPVSLDLREAYFELRGFILDNVDLKVGRQRIAWGTADKLNPTDNVNPLDMSDPWDFGRHLGSDGAQLTVYAAGLQFTGLAVAQFTPSVLPTGQWATALMPSSLAIPGIPLGTVTTNVKLPGQSIADGATAGLRIKGSLLGYDLSVSYLYGRMSIPMVDSVVVEGSMNVTAQLVYPRQHVFGADVAGSIEGVGVWAEAAVFLPEKVTMTTDLSALMMGVQQSTVLDSAAYVKYIIGADYTFPGGFYVNAQYLHGLFQEAGAANLEDYFAVNLDWKLFDDKLTISPFNFLFEVKNWADIPNNYAILGAPSLTFRPMDNAELVVGFHWIQATGSTAYAGMSGKNEVFAHARYSF